jgi:hypothetical protein
LYRIAVSQQQQHKTVPKLCSALRSLAMLSRVVNGLLLLQARAEGWAKTGIVSLLNEGLEEVPSPAWAVGTAIRGLELSGNRLVSLPAVEVGRLSGLRALRLAGNRLTAAGVPWAELAAAAGLLTLVLDDNPCASCLSLLRLNLSFLFALPGTVGHAASSLLLYARSALRLSSRWCCLARLQLKRAAAGLATFAQLQDAASKEVKLAQWRWAP